MIFYYYLSIITAFYPLHLPLQNYFGTTLVCYSTAAAVVGAARCRCCGSRLSGYPGTSDIYKKYQPGQDRLNTGRIQVTLDQIRSGEHIDEQVIGIR